MCNSLQNGLCHLPQNGLKMCHSHRMDLGKNITPTTAKKWLPGKPNTGSPNCDNAAVGKYVPLTTKLMDFKLNKQTHNHAYAEFAKDTLCYLQCLNDCTTIATVQGIHSEIIHMHTITRQKLVSMFKTLMIPKHSKWSASHNLR